MDKTVALQTLRNHETRLRALGVNSLYLFGSVAKGGAGPSSDVDLFFDYSDPKFSLFELIDLQNEIQRLLNCTVDVMSRNSLHPAYRNEIIGSSQRVF